MKAYYVGKNTMRDNFQFQCACCFTGYGFSGDLRLLRQAIPIWGDRHVINLLDMCHVQAAVCEAKEIVPTKESEKGLFLAVCLSMISNLCSVESYPTFLLL